MYVAIYIEGGMHLHHILAGNALLSSMFLRQKAPVDLTIKQVLEY